MLHTGSGGLRQDEVAAVLAQVKYREYEGYLLWDGIYLRKVDWHV